MLAYQDGYDWSRHGKNAVAAIDLVKTEGETSLLHQLLGRTVIVETLADALELASFRPREYRFVTRSGEVVEAAAATTPWTLGDMSKRGGIITRRAEVAKLEQELAEVEAKVQELTNQIPRSATRPRVNSTPASRNPPAASTVPICSGPK